LKNSFEISFHLWHFEMNKFGEATPTVILALLEEAAAEHCLSIGYGLYDLKEKDIGWVLLSGALEMNRFPRYKEKITIRTWLSQYSTIRGFRENIILDEQGLVIGKAKGLWIFYNIKERKPIPVYKEIKDLWSYHSKSIFTVKIPPDIKPLEQANIVDEIAVQSSDVDMYNHVNNIRYLQWLIDSIPDDVVEMNRLLYIEGRFISEIKGGDRIVMMTDMESDNVFIHTIRIKGSDKVCAVARTQWKHRALK